MQQMSAAEIRRRFLDYFERHGHRVVSSSSLVPKDDPTLLFTNAGMVQFKDVFTGKERLPFKRAASAQKCMRAGGKHNDLENVGRTARHHTFFEMLGNFSFGDYFKREAITFCWDFLTGELGLPPERLYVTIFQDDDEAFELWLELSEIPAERIVRLGEKDNFWAMGDTGPCGPCSEVVIDRGEQFSCGRPDCALDTCGCDRWLELWNLVFMQYNRTATGALEPLPRPSIDTGMGLERIASVLQGVGSNYDTDLFRPIIQATERLTGRAYDPGEGGFPFRVIADHVRACTFLIADGVFPSNEFRGYVLRRILRRAVRFGKLLGLEQPFLHRLVPTVAQVMGEAYPEVVERADYVIDVIHKEEERFHRTLNQGMQILEEVIQRVRAENRSTISGEEAFMLYDTYGFPIDLTEDAAAEAGLAVDRDGFEAALERQRVRARQAREEDVPYEVDAPLARQLAGVSATEFVGYERLRVEATVLAVLRGEERVPEAAPGQDVIILLDRTPFYAEGGGQVGDTGRLVADGVRVEVRDVKPFFEGRSLHLCRVVEGTVREGLRLQAEVDERRRWNTMRNHTATHLLHKALKVVLGDHANQAGSLVAPDRLRFDFTHLDALTPEQLREVEDVVNREILKGLPVTAYYTSLQEAREAGAMALFGEKYGEIVRVVRIGDFSLELCGGTHVPTTGQLGLFKIVAQSSVGAGVRRIEAVTGEAALRYVQTMEDELRAVAGALRCTPLEAAARVRGVLESQRALERALMQEKERAAKAAAERLLATAEAVDGVHVLVGRVPVDDAEAMRRTGDYLRDRLGSAVIVLGAARDQSVMLLAMASDDVVARGFHAGQLISHVARLVGGGGGGRPNLAQAGGKDPARLDEALAEARQRIRAQLDPARTG